MERTEEGWLGGPSPYDTEGRPLAFGGPQVVNPAFRFGTPQRDKHSAAADLTGSQKSRAEAVWAAVNLPSGGHFAAAIRRFQERESNTCLATAKADDSAANQQLPVTEERKKLAVAAPLVPRTTKMRGFFPLRQLCGATAAAPRYSTASRVRATMAAG